MTPPVRAAVQEPSLSVLLTLWYKRYVEQQFERSFVALTMAATLVIGYFVDNKLAFINFFYIPVFFAAYILDSRTAVLGSVFSVLTVVLYAVLDSTVFFMEPSQWGLTFHLLAWGSFLILSGAVVGRLNEKSNDRYHRAEKLVEDLQAKQGELEKVQKELTEANQALDQKGRAVEALKENLEAVLYSTMDPEVARLVVNRQINTEKKVVTMLFADLKGFTSYAEARQPELVIEQLNKYFNAVEPLISRFRGHLDKYIGDGLMAEFGAPLFFEHHALLAVLAAVQCRDRIAEMKLPLQLRIGIATGPAIVGLVGSERRKSYSAVGDSVNLAQRFESLCPPGGILVDEMTYQRVHRFFRTRRVRMGMEDGEAQRLESQLAEFERQIKGGKVNGEVYFEAGRIATQLGELALVVPYFKEALRALPQRREEIERALADAVLIEEERAKIEVKGKKLKVAAYEILDLKDPLEDRNKFPETFAQRYGGLKIKIASEGVLSIEGLDATVGQSRSTGLLSYALAEAMGGADDLKQAVLVAGYLHHVGKRYIPDNLLNREDADYDLQVLTGHVNEAPKVISELGIKAPAQVLEAIKHHHEVYGGGGYPSGLKGEEIPLASRIVQVASQYDSLTSWRPSREAWNSRAALSHLKHEAELGRYDPKVVAALGKALEAA